VSELDDQLIGEAYLSMLNEEVPPAAPSSDNPGAWRVGDNFELTDGTVWQVTHAVGDAQLTSATAHDQGPDTANGFVDAEVDGSKKPIFSFISSFFGAAPADGSGVWAPVRVDAKYIKPGSHKTKQDVKASADELAATQKAAGKEDPEVAGWAKGVQSAAQGMANSPGTGSGDYVTKGLMGGLDKVAGALGKSKPKRGTGAVRR